MTDVNTLLEMISQLDEANLSCLMKRLPGEPMFIVLGRDPDGGFITRLWAQRRFDAGDTEHANAVFPIADEMDAWASTHKPESAPPREAYDNMSKTDLVERLLDHARHVGGDESFDRLYGDEAVSLHNHIKSLERSLKEVNPPISNLYKDSSPEDGKNDSQKT